jgi:hypothetical protein
MVRLYGVVSCAPGIAAPREKPRQCLPILVWNWETWENCHKRWRLTEDMPVGAMQVQQLAAPLGGMSPDVAYSCCEAPPPPPPPPPPPEEQPGSISKQKEIREVHVSMALMEEFLACAILLNRALCSHIV